MKSRRQFSLLGLMIAVGLVALALAYLAAERQKRLVVLDAEIVRARERAAWADRMADLGYISNAQLASDQGMLKKLEVERTRLLPEVP